MLGALMPWNRRRQTPSPKLLKIGRGEGKSPPAGVYLVDRYRVWSVEQAAQKTLRVFHAYDPLVVLVLYLQFM